MRYRLDPTWQRRGTSVLAGSPMRLFRLTAAGTTVAAALERGDEVADSTLTARLVAAGAIHPAVHGGRYRPEHVTVVTPVFGGPPPEGRVLVDDGSASPVDGAALRLERNRGPAAARNAGRHLVDTPLVAFVDADVDLLDDVAGSWLVPLLGHFDDPAVGLVAPRIAGERNSPLDLRETPAVIRPRTRVSYVPAAAIVVRLDAFDDVGGFDETLRVGEDVDFVWRLVARGWTCRYEPASVVWHQPRRGLRARLAQQRDYGSSAAPLSLRHPTELSPWQADPPTAIGWAAAVAGQPALAVTSWASGFVAFRRRLGPTPLPLVVHAAIRAHAALTLQLAAALRREWWPVALVAALGSRRARRAVLLAWAAAPDRLATDLAYGLGVWQGMWRHRTMRPILPRIRRWQPGGD